MKFLPSMLLAMLSLTAVCSSASTNSFGIYLTAEPVDPRILGYGTGDWSHVTLQPKPLISDEDILVYDFTNHRMTLTHEAFMRLPRPSVFGTPFVVVADGERIYWGAFTTSVSSIEVFAPSIIPDSRGGYTNLPPDTLQVYRGYDVSHKVTNPDPRPDGRIKRALGALNKLKSDRRLYQGIVNGGDWRNPYLVVYADGVAVPGVAGHVSPEKLASALAHLPGDAWPYGRVVAVVEIGIRSGRDDELIRENLTKVLKVLEEIWIEAERWPSA
jgi:hypothetical protein